MWPKVTFDLPMTNQWGKVEMRLFKQIIKDGDEIDQQHSIKMYFV